VFVNRYLIKIAEAVHRRPPNIASSMKPFFGAGLVGSVPLDDTFPRAPFKSRIYSLIYTNSGRML